jgi:hypothetical protein
MPWAVADHIHGDDDMSDNKKDVLRKVRALLDKAESTTFSAERDSLLAKADAMMLKYAIESHELEQAGQKQREEPILRTFTVCMTDNPIRESMVDLAWATAQHARGKAVFTNLRLNSKAKAPIQMKVVGFPSDLDWCEMLLLSLQLQLSNEMEPKPDPSKTDIENATMMKAAGMTWDRIVELLGYANYTDDKKPTKERRRIIHGWRKHVKEQDPELAEQLMNNSPQAYQRSYAQGFVVTIRQRFTEMKQRQDQEARAAGKGESTALVLRDRDAIVNDKYREMFPNLAHGPARKQGKLNAAGWSRGSAAGQRADLSGGRGHLGQRRSLPGG